MKNILIGVFASISLLLLGFIAYDKFTTKDEVLVKKCNKEEICDECICNECNYYGEDDEESAIIESDSFYSKDGKIYKLDVYDVQKIISEYYGIDKCYSLEKSIELLNIKNDGEFHNAMSDAYHTMLLFKEICNNLNFSINETLSLFNNTVDKTTNGIVESVMINHLIKEEKYRFLINECKNNKISWEAKTILFRYMEKVNINKSIKHKFKNQKICFSKEIIENHCYEMFNIIHNLSFRGIKIVKNKDKCNYYICDKNSAKDTISLLENTSDNHKIIVITFEELLNELKITRDELINKELPSLNCITNINPYEYRKKGCKIKKSIREKERKEFTTYFGELFNKYKSEGKLCYN